MRHDRPSRWDESDYQEHLAALQAEAASLETRLPIGSRPTRPKRDDDLIRSTELLEAHVDHLRGMLAKAGIATRPKSGPGANEAQRERSLTEECIELRRKAGLSIPAWARSDQSGPNQSAKPPVGSLTQQCIALRKVKRLQP